MKIINTLLMSMLLFLGGIQLNAQIGPDDKPQDLAPCLTLVQVKQECNKDGTVDVTFRISNNTLCDASAITIYVNGIGQSYNIGVNAQSVSAPFTFTGTAGSTLCFEIILHGKDGKVCCKGKVCIDLLKECCLSLVQVKQECNDDGTVDVTFRISNNSLCDASAITIYVNGIGQSYNIGVNAQSVSVPFTFTGAPGETLCFDIILHGKHGKVCCEGRVCIDLTKECCDLNIKSVKTRDADCDDSNGLVEILISGGTPPYSGPFSQTSLSGLFTYGGLSSGNYTWTFYDSNGCEILVSFTIGIQGSDCSQGQLTFSRNTSNNTAPNFYQETFVSNVTATISAQLTAFSVHDQLIVTVNGAQVINVTAGTSNCGNGPFNDPDGGLICVAPCDTIVFTVLGDVCPEGGTWWVLNVGCNNGCSSPAPIASNSDNLTLRDESYAQGYYKEMEMNNIQPLKVFPNPVTDVLNITYSNSLIDYQSARIINSSGQVIYTVNMSGQTELQIDASAMPQGLYIVEVTDISGNRVIEKFTKLK